MATSWVSRNDYLSTSEMQNNAEMLLTTLRSMDFTFNSICAIAANMQAESGINPGIWEDLDPFVGGYGLVQWTPYTKYSQWAGADWMNNGQKQCERIKWEFDNGEQWSTDYDYSVNMTATQFRTSQDTPESLAIAFLWNYENPRVDSPEEKIAKEQERSANARDWYNYLLQFTFQPRLSMGDIYSSPYYTTWNAYWTPTDVGEINMPNCTAYAFGRWNELTDTRTRHSNFPTGAGYQWYYQGIAKGFEGGMTPVLGAAAVWDYMGWEDGEYVHTGHVAIVEQINFDSGGNPVSIVTSNSAWNRDPGWDSPEDRYPWFYTETILLSQINDPWGRDGSHFEGFLYNNSITPVPPTPPPPTGRKMPFIFYLKRFI